VHVRGSLVDAVRDRQAVLFAGAGISMAGIETIDADAAEFLPELARRAGVGPRE
jgi:hypothetical protein